MPPWRQPGAEGHLLQGWDRTPAIAGKEKKTQQLALLDGRDTLPAATSGACGGSKHGNLSENTSTISQGAGSLRQPPKQELDLSHLNVTRLSL
jgi:hypothetical protein